MNKVQVQSNMGDGEALVAEGKTLQRSQAGFTTAVTVQKSRNRADVLKACEEEAALAGDEFLYSWPVKDNRTGKQKIIEGPSIQLTNAAARNWGNCGVLIEHIENDTHYFFTSTFVDLETGFNLQRSYRQRKSQDMGKKMDKDRAEDIAFQIGQSKAERNVVANALPSWLIEPMKDKARENVVARITRMGVAKAKEKALEVLLKYGVDEKRIEARISKKSKAWKAEDLAIIHGAIKTLTDGMETAEDLFPIVESGKASTVKPAEKKETKKPTETKKPEEVKTAESEGPEDAGHSEGEAESEPSETGPTLLDMLEECEDNEQRKVIWKQINKAYSDHVMEESEYSRLSKINTAKKKLFDSQASAGPEPLNDNCKVCIKFPCPASHLEGPSNVCGMGHDENGNQLKSMDERKDEQQSMM